MMVSFVYDMYQLIYYTATLNESQQKRVCQGGTSSQTTQQTINWNELATLCLDQGKHPQHQKRGRHQGFCLWLCLRHTDPSIRSLQVLRVLSCRKCTWRLQRYYLCIWSNWRWQNFHNGGWLQGPLMAGNHSSWFRSCNYCHPNLRES